LAVPLVILEEDESSFRSIIRSGCMFVRRVSVMAKIAVDVVLLPCEAMTEIAIAANRRLTGGASGEIVLDDERCLPHISLAMGCIEEGQVNEVGEVIGAIAGEYGHQELKAVGIGVGKNFAGQKVSWFEIERTEMLRSLHEAVMARVGAYFSYDVTEEMILGEVVSESSVAWIRDYPEKASFEDFLPHITIGYGEIRDFPCSIEFSASILGLCHLGNHCTCRRILASSRLGEGL